MERRVAPMIHVPDVAATVAWYQALDFTVIDRSEDDGELTWAMLAYGSTAVMFNAGGKPNTAERREVDLYVTTAGIDALYARVRGTAEVVAEPNDAFYGMREFTVRDPNGFWVTFGERKE